MTIADVNSKIAQKVVGSYKTIENTTVTGYKKVENAVTNNYEKIENKFIDKFLRKNHETVAEAKARLERGQLERKEKQAAEAKVREQKMANLMAKPTAHPIKPENKK